MLGTTYYHQTLRKYVAVFGTLFNDINIQRKNSGGEVVEQIKVPIVYEAKIKCVYVCEGDQNQTKVFLPLYREWGLI